ncbi:MAG: hypothetical protein WAW96_17475, partial [Alphaproteobacteria bacterium]
AQIGQRFIDQAAKKMADDFFARFAAAVAPSAAPAPEPPTEMPAPEPPPAAQPSPHADQSPAQKLAVKMRASGIPLAPGPEEHAEMKRNLPMKLLILGLVIAIIIAVAILKH